MTAVDWREGAVTAPKDSYNLADELLSPAD
jgi:hypothetical protein